jgi:hypothetical protein
VGYNLHLKNFIKLSNLLTERAIILMHYSSLPTPNITGNYSFRLNFPMEAGIIRISVNDSNRYAQMYECWKSRHEMIVCSDSQHQGNLPDLGNKKTPVELLISVP